MMSLTLNDKSLYLSRLTVGGIIVIFSISPRMWYLECDEVSLAVYSLTVQAGTRPCLEPRTVKTLLASCCKVGAHKYFTGCTANACLTATAGVR